ncbi:restriction endonuclease subunit S [Flagellimonas alvinocaridis]|uniref:Restriction endonuclease subunit S n=1 Tax=Flagellimonas alvinocaridis TaxID=2530200 RepID=A0A4S8RTE6_9FLAO|nr:restriction endonuclease subunit S [Allomuricauda alvinocaridis]THV61302.1 restriction endonuclease subunit S [Allomuricauda alvinocaridis]
MGKLLKPKLRFPEFQNNWEQRKINSLGVFLGGGTPITNNKDFWNGEVPWISSSDILEESIHLIKKTRFISEKAIKESATKIIPKGSVLIVSRVGIGKFAVADEDLCTSQDFTNLDCTENSYFIAYYFKARSNRFRRLSQGTSIQGFTAKDIKTLKFACPKLPEQQKIASFLSAVDDKITQLIKKKALVEQYKKGVMQQFFSQEIRFKDDDGKDYPEWQSKHLGEVLKIGSGRDYKHLGDGAIPVFGSGGIMTKVNEFIYDGESVGIGRKGTIDKPIFLTGKFWTVDTLFFTHSFRKVLPKFIYYIFNTINWYRYNEASGVPSLSKKTIENISVKIPCIQEQSKITNFLSALDERIIQVDYQIEKTTVYKKGLLQQMFV